MIPSNAKNGRQQKRHFQGKWIISALIEIGVKRFPLLGKRLPQFHAIGTGRTIPTRWSSSVGAWHTHRVLSQASSGSIENVQFKPNVCRIRSKSPLVFAAAWTSFE